MKRNAGFLSRGQMWKAGLACVAAIEPELWLADEPFASGMDAIGMGAFRRLARSLVSGGSTVIYTTQIFYVLAVLHGFTQFANGLGALIPAAIVFWSLSTPIIVSSKVRVSLRRKKGTLPLHFVNSVVILALSVLWLISGIGGMASAYLFAAEGPAEVGVFLFPAAIGGILLSAVFARVVFEAVHNEIRHRRYDWMSKME